jgi:hypothetical protein
LTTPQPPRGAYCVGEFDSHGVRVIYSEMFSDGQLGAKAAACQSRSGVILDDDGDEPAVLVGDVRLLPARARQLARNLLSAAAIADKWALDSAIAREGAKQRHPAGRAAMR